MADVLSFMHDYIFFEKRRIIGQSLFITPIALSLKSLSND